MIRSRQEALQVLGLMPQASNQEIKTAYKNLAQQFHPDVLGYEDKHWYEILEAYEYLMQQKTYIPPNPSYPYSSIRPAQKIVGNANHFSGYASERQRQYEKQQKLSRQRKKEKKLAFEKEMEEFHIQEEEKKKEAEKIRQKALDVIHAVRMAEIIEEILKE